MAEEADVKREDRLALAALDAVMREFAAELRRNAPQQQTHAQRHPREQFGVIASGPKADEVRRARWMYTCNYDIDCGY